MSRKSNVELVIRARNEATTALRGISDALKQVVDDQRDLADQAGSTESRLGRLGRELDALGNQLTSLRGVDKLSQDLTRTEQSLRKQKAAAQEAQNAYAAFAKSVSDAGRPTKRLQSQLATKKRRMDEAREKTRQLQVQVRELAQQYTQSRQAIGGLDGDQDKLAQSTARAAAEYTALQTQIRELRTASKSRAAPSVGPVDAPSMTAAAEAVGALGRRLRDVGQQSDLTKVDLQELESEIKSLEATGRNLGALKGMVEDFKTLHQQSLQARRTWKDLEQQTRELAREFNATAQPSRELAENLGRARAASRQAKQGYLDARSGVQQYSRALQQAGVNTRNLDGSLRAIEQGIQRTSTVLAQGQVSLDRWTVAQKEQVAASQQAAAASQREAQARREAARQVLESQRVYRQTRAAVDEASEAYRAATDQVTRIAQAMREAEQPSAALASEFDRAKRRARELKTTFTEVRDAYGLLGQSLTRNRQDASAVAAAQQRLENAMQASGTAMRRNGEAAAQAERNMQRLSQSSRQAERSSRDVGSGAREAGAGLREMSNETRRAQERLQFFRDEGRTTLSLLQRIRGQVLALASAYVGLFGAIRGIEGVYGASIMLEASEARLASIYGEDTDQIAADLAFVREISDELGLSFRTMQESYAKFMIAATQAGAPLNEAQAGFVAISKAARAYKLTDDQVGGVFMAVEQMYSKGQVMAEELRRQLGDRLPGAFATFARAIGVTSAELDEMLERGEVKADSLIHFFLLLEEEVSRGLPAAMQSTQSTMERFGNAIYDIQVQIGRSGFLEELTKGLEQAEEMLSSADTQEGARRLGELLGELTKAAVGVLDSIELLATGLKILAGALAARGLLAAGRAFMSLTAAVTAATTALSGGAAGAGGLVAAAALAKAAVLAAAFAWSAWSIAEWAAKEFPAFGRHWEQLKGDMQAGFYRLQAAWRTMGVYLTDEWSSVLAKLGRMFMTWYANIASALASVFELVGDGPISRGLRSLESRFAGAAADGLSDESKARLAQIEAELEAQIDGISSKLEERLASLGEGSSSDAPTDWLRNPAAAAQGVAEYAKEVADLQDEIVSRFSARELAGDVDPWFRDISSQLDRFAAELADRSATTLEERLALIRSEFDDLLGELERRGDTEGIAMIKELIRLRQEEEKARFAAQSGSGADREAERMAQELDRVRRSIKELTAETLEDRIALIRDEFADLYAYMQRIGNQAGVDAIDQLIALRAEQERVRFEQEQQRALADEQREHEQQLNNLFQLRRDLQEQINFLRESGAPGADDAIETLEGRIKDVNLQLEEAIEKAMVFAQTLGDPNLIAALELMRLRLVDVEDQLISAEQVNRVFASTATNALDGFAQSLAEGRNVIRSVEDAFRQFAAEFLRQIANMILQQAIFNALQAASGGGVGGAIAGLFHTGGIVGTSQGGPSRAVPAVWFNNAVRYHTGGIAGLRPNEVPAILERGEEVLTKNDPRHATNGGAANQQSIKIINTLNPAEVLSAAMADTAGEQVLMNTITKNRRKIRQMIGG
ncbi:tape measure protein [uncultured Halomonas sp.]|uniref:tape measure protein n=1 Tax=uncultured Halomonas sp. TaxID=173971 RepID=UPI002608C677|nr:tape measure protein [uncultured Halomonas sp.]